MAAAVRAPVAGLRLTLRVCLPFLAGYFLSYVYRAVNAVLGTAARSEFSLSAGDLGLLTGAYFFACGLFQVPLGLLLDRFGPRRTDALLLLVAAAGAALFVSAHSFAGLFLGRALIGIGVSAALMACFQAFVLWYPAERIGTMIAVAYAAGAVGAMTVSVPFEYALRVTDWRTIFWVFIAATLGASALLLPWFPSAVSHPRMNPSQCSCAVLPRSRAIPRSGASPSPSAQHNARQSRRSRSGWAPGRGTWRASIAAPWRRRFSSAPLR